MHTPRKFSRRIEKAPRRNARSAVRKRVRNNAPIENMEYQKVELNGQVAINMRNSQALN